MTLRVELLKRAQESARFGRSALLIFATALAIRAAHLWSMRHSPFFEALLGDAAAYDAWAQQIAGGDWLGHEAFYQAPLYAYFLAAIYSVRHSLVLVRVCQILLGAASCALLGYATRQLFDRSAGVAAGLTLAVYAPAIFFDALIQKSVLDVLLICVLLALLSGPLASPDRPDSQWRWFAIGIALGALTLTRENALVFAPIVLCWIWWRPARHTGRDAAMLLAGVSLVLLPVGLRNLMVGGEFHVTTTQSGPNLFIGNNPLADGTYVSLRSGRGSPEYERQDAGELASQGAGRALSPGEVSSYWTNRALDYIRTNPSDWLRLEGRKLRLLFNVTEVMDTESQESHEAESPPLAALARVAPFGVLLPLASFGVWITWGDRRRLWLLHAMAGAYALSVLAFYVVARYRLPLVPFLIVFASAAVGHGRSFLAAQTRMGAITGVAVIAAIALLCSRPAVSADAMRAATYQNLGAAYQEAGRLDEAAGAFDRALSLDPRYAPAHNGLGAVLRRQGQLDRAVAHLEEARRLSPDFDTVEARSNLGVARYELGNAYLAQQRLAEAVEQFREAVRLSPRMVEAHNELGIALGSLGRFDEAIEAFGAALRIDPGFSEAQANLKTAIGVRSRPR